MARDDGGAARELFLIDGNSLAYRAFFALPESIATSDGRPTNAIFGFASMLVKILTDYGQVPTVVVWDAGMSGRKEISADYKAQRSSRPDLLKLQWPHLRPLVEAFGYRNISVEGFEADDVIATLAEQAKERGIPVMVVTGDRDAYQLVDDGVRIMTTSRGITDTKVYDRQGVIDRYGIPPELVPDFIGLKGDTSRQHPGRPRHRRQDGRGAAAALRRPRGRAGQRRRHLRRQAQAEPDRARRRRAALQAARDDGARRPGLDLDLEAELEREPDRSQPARGLPRVGAARPAAPARGGARGRRGSRRSRARRRQTAIAVPVREGGAADLASLPGDELALVAEAPEPAEGELLPREPRAGASAPTPGPAPRSSARSTTRPSSSRPRGDRPVVAHDAKALGASRASLAFDTEVAAYLLDPARRGYPLDELCRGARPGRRRPRTRRPRAPCSSHELAARQREQLARARPDRPARRHRAAARARPARDREGRHQARHARASRRPRAASAATPRSSSARSGSWRARSS